MVFIWRNYLTLSSCYLELGEPIFFNNKNDAEKYLKYPELNIGLFNITINFKNLKNGNIQ